MNPIHFIAQYNNVLIVKATTEDIFIKHLIILLFIPNELTWHMQTHALKL